MIGRVRGWSTLVPGLAAAIAVVSVSFFASWRVTNVSALTIALVAGVLAANLGLLTAGCDPGLRFAARHVLRAGIVLLGLQLSFEQVSRLGVKGVLAVAVVVALTFFGTQLLARALGVDRGLGLLTATGFSICGVSAVSAMVGAVDGKEEDATYAIALVTLFGSASIAVLPLIGQIVGAGDARFGMWSGAAVHDVAQVVATASAYSPAALAPAVLIKLTRVLMLAPVVTAAALRHRRGSADPVARVSPLPAFIVLFLVMVGVRSTGVLPDGAIEVAKGVERVMLATALFGLGTSVRLSTLRGLGGRPLLLGVAAWILVMTASSVAIRFVPIDVIG